MAGHINKALLIFTLISVTICSVVANNYAVPSQFHATVKVFHPMGLEVSIPDASNISLFAFHGKLNDEMEGREAGTWARDIPSAKNGRWTFRDKKAEIKIGDTLYYWTTIVFSGLAYYQDDGIFKVEKYDNAPEIVHNSGSINTPVQPNTASVTPSPPPPQHCDVSITTVNNQATCKGQLIFDEQFNAQLDNQKWNREVRIPLDTEDAEFVSYQRTSFNSYIEEGNLAILPSLLMRQTDINEETIYSGTLDLSSQCTATRNIQRECSRSANSFYILPPVVSAKLNTKNSFKFRYGKIEIRAKMPKGDWIFPQLYLEPSEYQYGYDSFASGMLRVAFSRGNEYLETADKESIGGEQLCGGAVLSRGNTNRNLWMRCTTGNSLWSSDFHVYGLRWTDTEIQMSVDGQDYGMPLNFNFKNSARRRNITHSTAWNDDNNLSPFDREFFISLGVGVGGTGDFPDQSKSGAQLALKPWGNTSPKGELHFFSDIRKWVRSWNDRHSRMLVDYVRVWAI